MMSSSSSSSSSDANSDGNSDDLDQFDSQSRDGGEGEGEGEQEEEDPHCYMVWARMNNREQWWPAYRCEDSKLAPPKPRTVESASSTAAEAEDEVELIAFYTGRKSANNQTKHLLAWIKSRDVRPYATFRFRDSVEVHRNRAGSRDRSRDFRDSVKEADADYSEYLKCKKDADARKSVDVASTTEDRVPATLMEQQSTSIIDQETIGYTVSHLPDGLKQTLQPGRKGFVVQMLEGKRQRRPNTVLMVDHTDKTTPFYSHAVTDESFMKAALAEEGAEVEADFMGDGIYYRGRIARANRDGTFDIAYDDGDFEANKCVSGIRRLANIEPTSSNADTDTRYNATFAEDTGGGVTPPPPPPPPDDENERVPSRHIPTNLAQTLQPGRKGFVVEVLDGRRRERVPTQNFYSGVSSSKSSSSSSSSSSAAKTLESSAKSSSSPLASIAPTGTVMAATKPAPLGKIEATKGKNENFAKGDRVEGQWMQGDYFYPGRIAEVVFKRGRTLYNIAYDDGGYEPEVEDRFIRREMTKSGKRRAMMKSGKIDKPTALPSDISTEGAPTNTQLTQEMMAVFDRRNTRIEFMSSGSTLDGRGGRAKGRFEKYRAATTVDEFIRLGGQRHDFEQDIRCSNLRVIVDVDFSKQTKEPSTKAKMKPKQQRQKQQQQKPSKMAGSIANAPKKHRLLVQPMKKTSAKRARKGAALESIAGSSKVARETAMSIDNADDDMYMSENHCYHQNGGYMYGGYSSEYGEGFDVICSVCMHRYDSRQQGVSREEYIALSQSWCCSNCVLNRTANRHATVHPATAYAPSLLSGLESEHGAAGGGGGGGVSFGGDLGALLAAAEQIS